MYAEGAGKVSVPLVLYVSVPDVKGSAMSGLRGSREGFVAEVEVGDFWEKGWDDRSRIAWVIVGWKRPPCIEYAPRWVGRT